jgi:hypothetical protein
MNGRKSHETSSRAYVARSSGGRCFGWKLPTVVRRRRSGTARGVAAENRFAGVWGGEDGIGRRIDLRPASGVERSG